MVKVGKIELGEFPLILAPMEDVSDPPFRKLCKRFGANLVYSEFVSSEGLIRQAAGSIHKMDIETEERPVTIQIFGHNEESMKQAAIMVEAYKPDIIDLNFGCPVKKVVSKGAGAAALKDVPAMIRMAKAVVNSVNIPVTAKTRLGWDEDSIIIEEVVEMLQDVGISAIAIHARTAKQLYSGTANWEWLGKVMSNTRLKIPVFGNGDVDGPMKARELKDKYPVDGLMIGRAAIGNPWIFREIRNYLDTGRLLPPPALTERVSVCRTHLLESVAWKGEKLGVLEMRKHYKKYFHSITDVKDFRMRLVSENELNGVLSVLEELENKYQ
jgi:tRNA-dihydrouridine synthase B